MKQISIDIYSDVVCPWCYLGQRRLTLALAEVSGELAANVAWKPFQLDPNVPPEGYDTFDYLARKIGGAEQVKRSHAMLASLGAEIGLPFALEKASVFPNTFDAHRLIHWAGQDGDVRQDAVTKALFEANFVDGKNVADHAVLLDIAEKAGMDRAVVAEKLASDTDADLLRAAMDHAHAMGVTGVPFFVINGKYALSGAQNVDVFVKALTQIADMA